MDVLVAAEYQEGEWRHRPHAPEEWCLFAGAVYQKCQFKSLHSPHHLDLSGTHSHPIGRMSAWVMKTTQHLSSCPRRAGRTASPGLDSQPKCTQSTICS